MFTTIVATCRATTLRFQYNRIYLVVNSWKITAQCNSPQVNNQPLCYHFVPSSYIAKPCIAEVQIGQKTREQKARELRVIPRLNSASSQRVSSNIDDHNSFVYRLTVTPIASLEMSNIRKILVSQGVVLVNLDDTRHLSCFFFFNLFQAYHI